MNIWLKLEFRGRDPYHNPFVDFGFVEVKDGQLVVSSHLLRQPLWVDCEKRIIPTFRHYYEARGFSQLRYKVLWTAGAPVDTAVDEGWKEM